VDVAPVEKVGPPPVTPAHPSVPSHVAAHALRAAFWFEQASAFRANDDDEAPASVPPPSVSVPPPSPAPEIAPDRHADVESDSPAAAARDCAQDDYSGSSAWTSRSWVVALCLLALIALVVVLTGRDPRRLIGAKTS
jgi:hypothetical protein